MHKELYQKLVAARRHMHKYPELSGQETDTSDFLQEKVREAGPDQIINFNNCGFIALFNGGNSKSVMVRADFDALPIQEVNHFEHKSHYEGISHKCGHDGHSAILLGLAHKLKDEKPAGDVFLIFQPAEETGSGAVGMINDSKFHDIHPDYVVALHNLPGYPLHEVVSRPKTFTAAANSMIIKFFGKTAHAAQPEKGKNPALAMARITERFQELSQPDLDREDFRIATPIYTTMGEKSYGVSAGYGELHFTLRAWKNEIIEKFENDLEQEARRISDDHDIEIKITWTEKFYSNQNDEDVYDAILKSAEDLDLKFQYRETPFRWGEDFGLFTEKFKGAMFGLGAGEDCPALHNPDYDFPDELIKSGSEMFYKIIQNLQS